MKKTLVNIAAMLLFLLFLSSSCFALSVKDNGHAWGKATYPEKTKVCEILVSNDVRSLGENVSYWISALNEFYNSAGDSGLSMTIWEVAVTIYYLQPR